MQAHTPSNSLQAGEVLMCETTPSKYMQKKRQLSMTQQERMCLLLCPTMYKPQLRLIQLRQTQLRQTQLRQIRHRLTQLKTQLLTQLLTQPLLLTQQFSPLSLQSLLLPCKLT